MPYAHARSNWVEFIWSQDVLPSHPALQGPDSAGKACMYRPGMIMTWKASLTCQPSELHADCIHWWHHCLLFSMLLDLDSPSCFIMPAFNLEMLYLTVCKTAYCCCWWQKPHKLYQADQLYKSGCYQAGGVGGHGASVWRIIWRTGGYIYPEAVQFMRLFQ